MSTDNPQQPESQSIPSSQTAAEIVETESPNLTPTAKRQKTSHQDPTMSSSSSAAAAPILESFQLEHVPPTHSVHVAVFRDVENAAFLHEQLLARNADFEYAFIDGSVVCHVAFFSPPP